MSNEEIEDLSQVAFGEYSILTGGPRRWSCWSRIHGLIHKAVQKCVNDPVESGTSETAAAPSEIIEESDLDEPLYPQNEISLDHVELPEYNPESLICAQRLRQHQIDVLRSSNSLLYQALSSLGPQASQQSISRALRANLEAHSQRLEAALLSNPQAVNEGL